MTRVALLLVVASAILFACKAKEDSTKSPPPAEPAKTESSKPATIENTKPAEPPHSNLPPLEARKQFLDKLDKIFATDGSDCAKLDADLTGLTDEAKAMAMLGKQMKGDELKQDDARLSASFKTILSRSQCHSTQSVDNILNILTR